MTRNPAPGSGDHRDDMRRWPGLDDVTSEALVTGSGDVPAEFAPLVDALGGLRGLAAGSPPAPSAELAALLEDGIEPAAAPAAGSRRAWRGRRARLGMVGILTAGALFGGAAAGALPRPLQNAVTRLVDAITPSRSGGEDAPTDSVVPPSVTPTPPTVAPARPMATPSAPPRPEPATVTPSPTPAPPAARVSPVPALPTVGPSPDEVEPEEDGTGEADQNDDDREDRSSDDDGERDDEVEDGESEDEKSPSAAEAPSEDDDGDDDVDDEDDGEGDAEDDGEDDAED